MGKPQTKRAWTGLLVASLAWALAPAGARAGLPPEFRWGGYGGWASDDLLSPVSDQLRLGPCFTFAAVGLVETMNNLLYGPDDPGATRTELSERYVYNCGGYGSMEGGLERMRTSGALYTSCDDSLAYPTGTCLEKQDQYPNDLVRTSLACETLPRSCGRRIRPDYRDVSAEMARGDAAIQALLVDRGPIALSLLQDPSHGSASHGTLLYGWETVGGALHWLVRDSWPCGAGLFSRAASDLQLPTRLATADWPRSHAYVIDALHHEALDAAGTWVDVTPAPRQLVLRPISQVVKLGAPPCFNQGEIPVTGLDLLPGAQVVDWSFWTNGSATLTFPGGKPTLAGNAYDARVTVTVRRANGMVEKVPRDYAYLGMPVQVTQASSACAGTRREIQLTSAAMTPGIASWTIHVDPSSRGSYYVLGNDSTSPRVVFTTTDSASYRIRVTGAAPGCAGTFGGYVMGMPCIAYPGYPY